MCQKYFQRRKTLDNAFINYARTKGKEINLKDGKEGGKKKRKEKIKKN